jgi:hypothetical protein
MRFRDFAAKTNPLPRKPTAPQKPQEKRKYLSHGFYVGQRVYYYRGQEYREGTIVELDPDWNNPEYVWALWGDNIDPTYVMNRELVHPVRR